MTARHKQLWAIALREFCAGKTSLIELRFYERRYRESLAKDAQAKAFEAGTS
jgi:hypothetical protein